MALIIIRICGPSLAASIRTVIVAPVPFLASTPTPDFTELIRLIRREVQPGERLYFEESGLSGADRVDPFSGRHYSPVIPAATGVEVIGGPYLYVPLRSNFTQFGGGSLFGNPNWDRDWFVRYARIYRPAAIVCWTNKARLFCRQNPDLVRIVAESSTLTVGRVLGFEGSTVRGSARVEAAPNRLIVRDLVPDTTDGLVVLRYHWTPGLVADPPVPLEPTTLEADPVPFIALRPTGTNPGPVTIRMAFPPR